MLTIALTFYAIIRDDVWAIDSSCQAMKEYQQLKGEQYVLQKKLEKCRGAKNSIDVN